MTLDIIFSQSGDFYNQDNSSWWLDLFNTILGAGIGSGATIWALYVQLRRDKKKEKDEQRQFRKEKIQYLQSLTQTILKSIETQIESSKEYAIAIKAKPAEVHPLQYTTFVDLDRIVHKINLEDYYHAYLGEFGSSQEVVNEYQRIIALFDYFDSVVTIGKDRLKWDVDFINDGITKLQIIIESLIDKGSKHIWDNELKKTQPNLWAALNSTFTEMGEKKGDMAFFHNHFVLVLEKKINAIPDFSEEASSLLVQLRKAKQLYFEIVSHNNRTADDYTVLQQTMSDYYSKLQTLTKRLRGYKSETKS